MTRKPISEEGTALAPLIDHTLLRPDARREEVVDLCREAVHYGFATVCIHPVYVPVAVAELAGTPVAVCTVVGFPLGATTTTAKAFEAEEAVRQGAQELDMVLALATFKNGDHDGVRADIRAVVTTAGDRRVKVIIETALLDDAEKVTACRLAVEAGAGFVKTCTGFSGGGATVDDIRLMRRTVDTACGVKASGGIRALAQAQALVDAGANRLGTSAGVTIVTALA